MKTAKEILQGYANRQKEVHLTYDVVLQAMEEYSNQSKWIDVNDELPDSSATVLFYEDDEYYIGFSSGGYFVSLNDYSEETGHKHLYNVTHWQPLPTEP